MVRIVIKGDVHIREALAFIEHQYRMNVSAFAVSPPCQNFAHHPPTIEGKARVIDPIKRISGRTDNAG